MEEEEILRQELKKIEARKKEREKKTQDLQKLIAQADSSGNKSSHMDKKALKKKLLANGGSVKSPTKEQMDTGGKRQSCKDAAFAVNDLFSLFMCRNQIS